MGTPSATTSPASISSIAKGPISSGWPARRARRATIMKCRLALYAFLGQAGFERPPHDHAEHRENGSCVEQDRVRQPVRDRAEDRSDDDGGGLPERGQRRDAR